MSNWQTRLLLKVGWYALFFVCFAVIVITWPFDDGNGGIHVLQFPGLQVIPPEEPLLPVPKFPKEETV